MPTSRLAFLDGIRAVCALYVVWHHMYLQLWPGGTAPAAFGVAWWLTFWLIYGHYAVDVFIVVSGFCLALPVLRKGGVGSILEFYGRRCRRILPPYYASMGVCLLLLVTLIGKPTGTHWDNSVDLSWQGVLLCALLLQDYFPTIVSNQVNHVYWSIAVEWHIYFLFPVLVWLWRRIGVLSTTVLTAVVTLPLYWLLRKTEYQAIHPHYLLLFSLGAVGAFIAFGEEAGWQRLRRLPWQGLFWGVSAAVLAVLSLSTRQYHGDAGNVMMRLPTFDVPVGIAAMALLIHLSGTEAGALMRFFTGKSLVFVGAFSYSLYLLHAPLIQLFWQYGVAPFQLPRLVQMGVLAFPVTAGILALSHLFYRAFERPYLTKTPRPR
jgi:peptidoglycan/LPS O-acetylase OafA/YrhL